MILALPGMGADKRIFPGPWNDLEGFRVVDWPRYADSVCIPNLAARIAADYNLEERDSLIGTSLGGMVACEIAKLRPVSKLVLVASATGQDEVGGLLAIPQPFVSLAPIGFLRSLCASAPGEIARMFADSDPAFIRSMCRAIFEWDGMGVAHAGLFRIHGQHDIVIPHPARADLTLDGGHLIAMTHAEECVAFLERSAPEAFRRGK